jgi:formiminotetrahydrofolate cyclodeaminase
MSFLVDLRTKQIEGEHTKAIGVFGKAIKKFEEAIVKANDNVTKNLHEVHEHRIEIEKREQSNILMEQRIKAMQTSINKIKQIVGDV